ncbi:MAG: hypothetical protein ACM30G_00905 [Micromonosporaceae bacterium]
MTSGSGHPSSPSGAWAADPAYPSYPTQPTYPAQTYPAQTYPGQTYPTQTYPAQTYPAQTYPAQTSPGQPTYPAWPPPPPAWALPPQPKRSWRRWLLGTLAVVLVCCVGGAGALVGYASATGAFDSHARWISGEAGQHPPAADASVADWRLWVFRAAGEVLVARGAAVAAGDEAAFLAPLDPGNAKLISEETRRFRVLRQMGAGVYRESVTGTPEDLGQRSWRLDTDMFYCFGPATCSVVRLPIRTEWSFRSDGLRIAAVVSSAAEWNGPRPWEVADLQVRTGNRVVLAATKSNAWRLADAVRSADSAALVADTFAKWHEPPSRYVIFLAGPNEWKTWYGHEQPDWAAAWAVPVGNLTTEVVVRTDSVRQSTLQGLLSHELTHVTSLAGDRSGLTRNTWWLVEGIADYAEFLGKPVRLYDALAPTRTYVHGSWDGDIAVSAPGSDASVDEAAAHYGVAFLAVRRIAERYGQEKMIKFFGAVVHEDKSLETAASSTLGASWASVSTDCAKFVRSSVG